MNRTIVAVIEIMVAVFVFGLIIFYVQGTLNKGRYCEGTPPEDSEGLIKGPSIHNVSIQSKKWTYDITATTQTPCRWRCDLNYDVNQNKCIKKQVI